MLRALLIACICLIFSCQSTPSNSEGNSATEQKEAQTKSQVTTPDPEVALAFINNYVEFSSSFDVNKSMEDWVNEQTNVTEGFKSELARIMREAEAADPELGLGFDPIYNAQEFPDEGFVLDTTDGEYVIVKAKAAGWEGFTITIKLANENGT